MIRRSIAALCALALFSLPFAALAAPIRDERGMDIAQDEGLRGFLSTVMSAAVLKDVTVLEEGERPDAGLAEAVFAVFEYNMFGLDSVTLSEADCAALYDGFFAGGGFVMPEEGHCPCVKIVDGSMVMDLSELNETPLVGVHVWESEFRDGRLCMKADLYTAWGYYMTPPLDIPEEDLTWYCSAEICAESGEGKLFGWTLSSFRLGKVWQDGALSEWKTCENAGEGYSLVVPSLFGESSVKEGVREWQTADGLSSMRLEILPAMTFAQGLEMMDPAGGRLTKEEEFSYILITGERESRLLVCGENLPQACLVTLEYPEENMWEYTFYIEIIRNSLSMRGLAYG